MRKHRSEEVEELYVPKRSIGGTLGRAALKVTAAIELIGGTTAIVAGEIYRTDTVFTYGIGGSLLAVGATCLGLAHQVEKDSIRDAAFDAHHYYELKTTEAWRKMTEVSTQDLPALGTGERDGAELTFEPYPQQADADIHPVPRDLR